ncbi:Ptchd3 [Symbiodinium sp. CCMP2592]|nr:Ptchd3 [Symbiodinium sp. CCMP2592]
MENVKLAVNEWEDQENFCPLTIANANSPCFNDNCQKYDTTMERETCRTLARSYCATECPTRTFLNADGEEVTIPISMANCKDRGCIQLGSFEAAAVNNSNTQLNTDPNATGEAPESAFEFQPTKIKTMVGGLQLDANQKYTGGKYLSGFFALNKAELFCPTAGVNDPVADEWERRALCFMGVNADTRAEPKLDCPEDDLLKFSGLFQRSLGDEFGNAIRGDISKLTASYGVIIVYCAIMIGKCDAIHSGMFLSFVAVLIVGLTIGSTLGLMGYFGVPNGNLNNNLYFLLLGLGVDDAFVLSSEFQRHAREDKSKSIPERIAATARTGGISVLITSATDALAFLVGATTVLPALGWFCTYAGVSIVLCYTFQLTVFLPCLALNARRVESNRIDCCCCCSVAERSIEDPQGCCLGCCLPKAAFKGGQLSRGLKAFMTRVTTPVGQVVTFVLFAALTGMGIWGSTMIYKDFKLEWFIPDSSYVNEFFNINSEFFATGTPITVNMRDNLATFDAQGNLREMHNYLTTTNLVNQDVAVDSWYEEFMEWAVDPTQAATASAVFTPSRTDPDAKFQDSSAFYTALYTWYRGTTGSRYRGSMIWASSACNLDAGSEVVPNGCVISDGLRASRFNAELSLAATDKGTNRYDTMTSMRQRCDELYPGSFPYSFDFLYWEEVGVIDVELVRNLLICGGVILVVIFALVPAPRIAIWVVLCVALSIVDTLGFMYFWDVTISGVSTIYLLICVGLAVDYAAHIAHMFKESVGSPRERAISAIERIGKGKARESVAGILRISWDGGVEGGACVMNIAEEHIDRIPSARKFNLHRIAAHPPPAPGLVNRVAASFAVAEKDATCLLNQIGDDNDIAFDIAPDQRTVVYTDGSQIGFADITDPYSPTGTGLSTSFWSPNDVAVKDDTFALAIRREQLIVVNITSQTSVHTIELGERANDITISPDRTIAAIATDGSYMVQVNISDSNPLAWTTQEISDITNITYDGAKVEIRADNIAVLTLQSNSVLILNLTDATILNRFSAGEVNVTGIDTIEDGFITLNSSLTNARREPWGVAWLGDSTFFATADRRSRGFSIFDQSGELVFTSGNQLEQLAVSLGHYPESTADETSIDVRNVEYGTVDGCQMLFVQCIRASLTFVFEVSDPSKPEFLQVLPAIMRPSQGKLVPDRHLFVSISEGTTYSDIEAGLDLYQCSRWPRQFPFLESRDTEDGTPIGWTSVAGLTGEEDGTLYGIEGDEMEVQTQILVIDSHQQPPLITEAISVTYPNGSLVEKLQSQGIERIPSGFAIVEKSGRLHLLSTSGVLQASLEVQVFGSLSGVAYDPSLGLLLTDTSGFVQLCDLQPACGLRNFSYAVDAIESQDTDASVELQDVAAIGNGTFLFLETDGQGIFDAAVGRIYKAELPQSGGNLSKSLVADFLLDLIDLRGPVLQDFNNLAVTGLVGQEEGRRMWIVNDNGGYQDRMDEATVILLTRAIFLCLLLIGCRAVQEDACDDDGSASLQVTKEEAGPPPNRGQRFPHARPHSPGRRFFRRHRRAHNGVYHRQKWSTEPPTTPAPEPGKQCCIFNRIGFFAFKTQEDVQNDIWGANSFDIAPDQRTVVYSDHTQVGFADITDPYSPEGAGLSTSFWNPDFVAVKDNTFALATRRDRLIVVNITSQTSVHTIELGERASDIAISPDKTIAAIATEGSYMVQVNISDSNPLAWTTQVISDITNITYDGAKVEIRADNIAVLTLQSNSVLILNLTDATILDRFSAGEVNLTGIDTKEDDFINLTSSLTDVRRTPYDVAWLGDSSFFATADRRSRGFSIFKQSGELIFTSGNQLDYLAVSLGHYPESDSDEGDASIDVRTVQFGTVDDCQMLFVQCIRSSLTFVFEVSDPSKPDFLQALPAVRRPAQGKVVPDRYLYVSISEGHSSSSRDIDSGLDLYQCSRWARQFPFLESGDAEDGTPIPWTSVAGLTGEEDGTLYGIEGDELEAQTQILVIDSQQQPPLITETISVTYPNGSLVEKLQAQGIERIPSGFAIVEKSGRLHLLSTSGVLQASLDVQVFGSLSGVAYDPSLGLLLTDTSGFVQLCDLQPACGLSNFSYAVEDSVPVELRDVAAAGNGAFLFLETDGQGGFDAAVGRIYKAELPQSGGQLSKSLVADFLLDLTDLRGPVLQDFNSMAVTGVVGAGKRRRMWIVNDNGGYSSTSWETQLISLRTRLD